MKLKLYTEEQVLKIIQKSVMDKPETYYEVLKHYIPIELPSDEEIKENADKYTVDNNTYYSFINGAIWLKEQILNQNK